MDCAQARETLWPVRRPKLVGGRVEEAERHVESCSACRDHLAQNHVLRDAYEELRRAKAPIALRERVIAAIAHERARLEGTGSARPAGSGAAVAESGVASGRSVEGFSKSRRWRVAVFVAAAAGVAGLIAQAVSTAPDVGPTLGSPAQSDALVDAGAVFVEDYLRRAVGQDQIHTSDPATVRQWLARELGAALKPLQMAGLEIEGAEICLLEGRRGAMIVYRLDGTRISHYLVPREGVEERAPTVGRTNADDQGLIPPLVTWSTPSVEQALVGEIGAERLLEVVRSSS